LAKPPTGPLTIFNVYIILSKSSGRSSIRLLREFIESLLYQAMDPVLFEDDERLELLDVETRKWWSKMSQSKCSTHVISDAQIVDIEHGEDGGFDGV
jgi:hypothetical protein